MLTKVAREDAEKSKGRGKKCEKIPFGTRYETYEYKGKPKRESKTSLVRCLRKEKQMWQALNQPQERPHSQMLPMVRLGMNLHMEIQIPRLEMPGMKNTLTVQQEELGTQKMA